MARILPTHPLPIKPGFASTTQPTAAQAISLENHNQIVVYLNSK